MKFELAPMKETKERSCMSCLVCRWLFGRLMSVYTLIVAIWVETYMIVFT